MEFPPVERAHAWHRSPKYAPVLEAREKATRRTSSQLMASVSISIDSPLGIESKKSNWLIINDDKTDMRQVVLKAEDVAVFRGERLVFRDLSFAVPPAGALVLAGRNGSGKSTLLRLLAGLVRPMAGHVLWQGEDAFADLAVHTRRVAYVGHQDAVKPGLTVAENLRFAARLSGRPLAAALAAVGLQTLADLPARMLSAGQKRRLALSRLLLSAAPLWLLDEPTLGLDTAAIERFGEVLAAHRAAGGMVVAATHVPLPLADAATLRLG